MNIVIKTTRYLEHKYICIYMQHEDMQEHGYCTFYPPYWGENDEKETIKVDAKA